MPGIGRQVWLRRVPLAEAPPRGLGWTLRRLARRTPRPVYDVEVWEGARLAYARRTPHPALVLVRHARAGRDGAGEAVRRADAAPADWVTVPL